MATELKIEPILSNWFGVLPNHSSLLRESTPGLWNIISHINWSLIYCLIR